jgi:hypothetical protein
VLAAVEHQLSLHNHILDAYRVLVRVLVSGLIDNRVWVEDRYVGPRPWPQQAAIKNPHFSRIAVMMNSSASRDFISPPLISISLACLGTHRVPEKTMSVVSVRVGVNAWNPVNGVFEGIVGGKITPIDRILSFPLLRCRLIAS